MSQSMKKRIQMAHATLTTLQKAKLLFAGVHLYYMKMVYRTLIQSKMEYASFLCPCSTVAYHASQSLLQRLFQCCIGMRVGKSKIPRLIMMFNLETLGDRRRMMANAFASRVCNVQDDDTATDRLKVQARNTQKALETSISFRRLVASQGTKGKRSISEEERQGTGANSRTHAPPYTKNERFAPCVTNEVNNR